MTNAQKVILLFDYEDEGGKFLEKKTLAWAEHRLIVSRVEWIEKGVSVRLINRTAIPIRPDPPTMPSDRPWGKRPIHQPLWMGLHEIGR